MRHVLALILTILTSVVSSAVILITSPAAWFLWPPIVLLFLGLGRLFRRSPMSRALYAFPFCGTPGVTALSAWWNWNKAPPSPIILIDALLFLVLLIAPIVAVYSGYLRAIEGEPDVIGVMIADEEVEK